MKRKIIKIDRDKCDGCGICITACHEQALVLIDGKATLISDSYCDGLGDCLPTCPQDAIHIVEREAAPYDDDLVQARLQDKQGAGGCPSMMNKVIAPTVPTTEIGHIPSQLGNWPLQIQLVSPNAPYLKRAHLLIAADCTAFAYGDFHSSLLQGRVCLIGCPKLDDFDYVEKLAEIIKLNQLASITVVKMEVPCCTGTVQWVQKGREVSGESVPWSIHTITLEGEIVEG